MKCKFSKCKDEATQKDCESDSDVSFCERHAKIRKEYFDNIKKSNADKKDY